MVNKILKKLVTVACLFLLQAASVVASQLFIGSRTVDISPQLPVAVTGQFHLRIAEIAETPLIATAMVLETRGAEGDLAIMVSCDALYIPTDLVALVRQAVKKQLPDIDENKIFLNATHTHTAPVLALEGEYLIPKNGVTQVKDYRDFFVDKVSRAIVEAWEDRAPGSVAWGMGYAVAGYNRRIVYSDGTSGMSSKTDLPEFRSFEGSEDHNVNTLFFWDEKGKLTTVVVGIASPSQEVEGRYAVNADYWHPVREGIKAKYGEDVNVLGWAAAAGDITPHMRYRKAADDRMRNLRNLSRVDELARRINLAVDESFAAVAAERHSELIFEHHVEELLLPERWVTEKNYLEAKAFVQNAKDQIAEDPKAADALYRMMNWQDRTVKRYEQQLENPKPMYPMDLHVIRLGDIAICTNEFELFSDFGIRIMARSKALQTFVIQLAGSSDWGSYLPTQRAVNGGAYSAIIHSNIVGPHGGQVLVDRTLEVIDQLWDK
ncbi:hypothetical protein [uncultured Cyclobacterium sp.]|uniref:hypothetical protein n=1 Tax=uncultured Cyclobacterium sp. TaxID=453820 RepID=UPI0030EC659A|tara:strand:- start:22974 stop:24446 length:1473 start_codon:yes stop_codon:yes gene_type:complete